MLFAKTLSKIGNYPTLPTFRLEEAVRSGAPTSICRHATAACSSDMVCGARTCGAEPTGSPRPDSVEFSRLMEADCDGPARSHREHPTPIKTASKPPNIVLSDEGTAGQGIGRTEVFRAVLSQRVGDAGSPLP